MLHLSKRVYPAPSASAKLTHNPAPGEVRAWRGPRLPGRRGLNGLRSRRRSKVRTGGRRKGRLICHAGLQALASAMILTPFDTKTLFITAIGFVALQATRFFPAAAAAITLAAITVAADVKHPTARRKATNEFVKDGGTGSRHWLGEGTLDNRRRSCQDDSRYVGAPLIGAQ